MDLSRLSEKDVAERLAKAAVNICPPEAPRQLPFPIEIIHPVDEPPRPAAVLIPMLRSQGEWRILYTRRTDTLPEHSGQVAFPGGRLDPDDPSPEAAALREAHEEIGLEADSVRILGRIDSFITLTNYCVTPIVGLIPWPFPMRLALDEVSRVFTIPLAWLANPANRHITERKLPAPYPPTPVIYFQPFDNEVLWGVSAQITVNLLSILS